MLFRSALEQEKTRKQISGLTEELKRMRNMGEIEDTEFGRLMRYIERLYPALNAAKTMSGAAKSFGGK